MQVWTGFYVHGEMVGACFGKVLKQAFGFLDHQVHVERKFCGAAASLDDEGSHRQVGDEVAVHHIDVDPVRARRFAGGDLVS